MAQPNTKKAPEHPPSGNPERWVAAMPGIVGPDLREYIVGETIGEFDTWPEHAKQTLSRSARVVKGREYQAPYVPNRINVPPPQLVAQPAIPGESKRADDMFERMPSIDHFMKFGDDSDQIVVEGANTNPRPVQLEPGTDIQLADGTHYKVPELAPQGANATERMDSQEDNPAQCLWCMETFPGVASMKAHEAKAHAHANR